MKSIGSEVLPLPAPRAGAGGGEERCVEERALDPLSTSVGETIKVHEKLISICHGRVVFCV